MGLREGRQITAAAFPAGGLRAQPPQPQPADARSDSRARRASDLPLSALNAVAAVILAGRHFALGLLPLVDGDRLAGIDDLVERRSALVAPHEKLVGVGIEQLARARPLPLGRCPILRRAG